MTRLTHDDVTRHLDGAARGVADLLPDNEAGAKARGAAEDAAHWAHKSLEDAGVSREPSPEG